ncbi:hypothetical protein [Hoeflea sp.]|uniref:hypothetical protein n=1 Tax=Hoeflea sp. TaxID=1940281 RepID=UPI003B02D11D
MLISNFSKWLETFWWTRGIFAAISVAALLPSIVDLSRYEFLRAFHASLIAWNDIASYVGHLIGKIPYIPAVSPYLINLCIFVATICVPTAVGAAHLTANSAIKQLNKNQSKLGNLEYGILHYSWIALSVVVFFTFIFMGTGLYYGVISGEIFEIKNVDDTTTTIGFLILFILSFYFGARLLPGFVRGVVTVIVFLISLEVLYWLQTPYLTGAINNFACERVAHPDDEDCQAASPDQNPVSGS